MIDLKPGGKSPGISEMKKLFVRYGLLNIGAETGQTYDLSDALVVKAFQQKEGLPLTGVLDEVTRRAMVAPRCGMPDIDPLSATAVGGWTQRDLSFGFGKLSRQLNANAFKSAVARAFSTWSQHGITFREAGPAEVPDILVEWRPANDSDRSLVGQSIAHADYPPTFWLVVKALPLPIHFDDEEVRWTDGFDGVEPAAEKWDVETTALHEIGHTLGLVHDDDPDSVMHHRVKPSHIKRSLRMVDISKLADLYPDQRAAAEKGSTRPHGRSRHMRRTGRFDDSDTCRSRKAADDKFHGAGEVASR